MKALENISLKKQNGQLGTILVFVLIGGAYFALKYFELKMKQVHTPIIIRHQDIKMFNEAN
jgi:hypothetical protein